jgi:hypothetical protein
MLVVTPDEILREGLRYAGFLKKCDRKDLWKSATNVRRFKSFYGSDPVVYAQIFEDLQTTEFPEARIDTTKLGITLDNFLMGIHFLYVYPTRERNAGMFDVGEQTAAKWGWYFSKKVQALKKQKVCDGSMN